MYDRAKPVAVVKQIMTDKQKQRAASALDLDEVMSDGAATPRRRSHVVVDFPQFSPMGPGDLSPKGGGAKKGRKKSKAMIHLGLEVEIDEELAWSRAAEDNYSGYTSAVAALTGQLIHVAPPFTEQMSVHFAEVVLRPVASSGGHVRVSRSMARKGAFEVYCVVSVAGRAVSRVLLHSRLQSRGSPKPDKVARRLRRLLGLEKADARMGAEERCARCGLLAQTCAVACLGTRGRRHTFVTSHTLLVQSDEKTDLRLVDDFEAEVPLERRSGAVFSAVVEWGSTYTLIATKKTKDGQEALSSSQSSETRKKKFTASYSGPCFLAAAPPSNEDDDDDDDGPREKTDALVLRVDDSVPARRVRTPKVTPYTTKNLEKLGFTRGATRHDILDRLRLDAKQRGIDNVVPPPPSRSRRVQETSAHVLSRTRGGLSAHLREKRIPPQGRGHATPFRQCRLGWDDPAFDYDILQAEYRDLAAHLDRPRTAQVPEDVHFLATTTAFDHSRRPKSARPASPFRQCFWAKGHRANSPNSFCVAATFGEAADSQKLSVSLY